jgi:hypothetical protein
MVIAQYIVILLSAAFMALYLFKNKGRNWKEVALAAIITLLWVAFSGIYHYKGTNIEFLGINLFAFFAWTAGLVALKFAYDHLGKHKYGKAAIFYLVLLLFFEYFFYNFLGVQLSSSYPGLFGFELMHAPWYSQLYYFLAGPAYLLVLIMLKKNNWLCRHKVKKK